MKKGLLPARVDTGVEGLNDILCGGLPAGQMYLLEGTPGTGKTTLAMQFIRTAILAGEKGLYVTLSESKRELESSARSHGWSAQDLSIAEFVPDEASLNPEQQYTVFHPSEIHNPRPVPFSPLVVWKASTRIAVMGCRKRCRSGRGGARLHDPESDATDRPG